MGIISDFFHVILTEPLTNLFILLSTLTGNAGFGVILLTIIIRVATLPLTIKQMHSTRMMSALSPRLQELQKKYKDPRRRSEEQMKLYREAGVNPLGCLSSMFLQFPILISLYATFRIAVGEGPESLIKISESLYGWGFLQSAIPLNANFLWLHLGRPDPLATPVLVAATTYVLQKVTMLPTTDERMKAQNSMMTLMMPLIFGWITISLPSGLGLYYVLSNLIGIVMQYAYVGGGPFNWRALLGLSDEPVLGRALEARERNIEAARQFSIGDGDEVIDEQPARRRNAAASDAGKQSSTDASRRRYSSGKRRNRR